jgi:hypothetical protein
MQIRAILEAAAECIQEKVNVHPEIMVPQVCTKEELMRVKALVDEVLPEVEAKYAVKVHFEFGTMMEVVRACLRAEEIAEVAEFFSFGTNDLTQATFSFSREDAENKFLPFYNSAGILKDNPFEALDTKGVGQLMSVCGHQRSQDPFRSQGRHLRRAGRSSAFDALLSLCQPDLCVLLLAARADRPAGGGARQVAGRELSALIVVDGVGGGDLRSRPECWGRLRSPLLFSIV